MNRVIVEADGGSRGNPGPAAYGAVVRDAASGRVLAEVAENVGIATNNVAEYKGLIAGLRLAREVAPDADVEVRMDSKLVIEQMAGRWKVRHPDMRPLALEARRLAPADTTWTWVPRERNQAADALLNKVLDGGPPVRRTDGASPARPGSAEAPEQTTAPVGPAGGPDGEGHRPMPARGWAEDQGTPTTFLLLRHGATPLSAEKRFSGSRSDPALTPEGRRQVEAVADALAARGGIDAVIGSPARRAVESAEIVARALKLEVATDPGLAEADFGAWEGLTLAEIRERWSAELASWLSSTAVAPPGGESFDAVLTRVRRSRDRLIRSHPGGTVLVVTHVSPIKLLSCLALGVPPAAIFRMELSPASLTELHWYEDGGAALLTFGTPPPRM